MSCTDSTPTTNDRNKTEQIEMSNAIGDEIDMKAVIDAKFAAGEGVLTFANDTPDEVILAAIKQALKAGKPFTVIPA